MRRLQSEIAHRVRTVGCGLLCLAVVGAITLNVDAAEGTTLSNLPFAAVSNELVNPDADADATDTDAAISVEGDKEPLPEPIVTSEPEPAAGAEAAAESESADTLEAGVGLKLSSVVPAPVVGASSWVERPASRLGGVDRYETAVAITRQAYPGAVDTVIVATGEVFSDSLSAAPLSAKLKAPLLPVAENDIPRSVRTELSRLNPRNIIIVGGPGSISAKVESSLNQYASSVTRISGSDRYTTSAAIAQFGWPTGATDVYIAAGEGFADALSATTAAAKLGGPVLLVPGRASELPLASSAEINRLGASRIYIAGGPATVSPLIEASLSAPGRSLVRFAGMDRYEVSANVTNAAFSGSADVYWASGFAFADALAGAAAAGARGAALVLVEPGCIPSDSYSATDRLLPGQILVLGGSGTLGDSVRNGNECMSRPTGTSELDWAGAQELYAKLNQNRFELGLGALRVSDSTRGNPAQSWAAQIAGGQARNSGTIATSEPWVRYQVSAVTKSSSNRVQRTYDLMRSYPGAARWFYQPNAGARGFVSVGYATVSGQSAAVLFLGAGADG